MTKITKADVYNELDAMVVAGADVSKISIRNIHAALQSRGSLTTIAKFRTSWLEDRGYTVIASAVVQRPLIDPLTVLMEQNEKLSLQVINLITVVSYQAKIIRSANLDKETTREAERRENRMTDALKALEPVDDVASGTGDGRRT